jgi:hypothetical protein
MRRHVAGKRGHAPIFDLSYRQLRQAFCAALDRIGAADVGYVLHSLRHGGATDDFLAGIALLDIYQRGRWADHRGARRYINGGAAILTALRLPPLTTRCVNTALFNTRARFGLSS